MQTHHSPTPLPDAAAEVLAYGTETVRCPICQTALVAGEECPRRCRIDHRGRRQSPRRGLAGAGRRARSRPPASRRLPSPASSAGSSSREAARSAPAPCASSARRVPASLSAAANAGWAARANQRGVGDPATEGRRRPLPCLRAGAVRPGASRAALARRLRRARLGGGALPALPPALRRAPALPPALPRAPPPGGARPRRPPPAAGGGGGGEADGRANRARRRSAGMRAPGQLVWWLGQPSLGGAALPSGRGLPRHLSRRRRGDGVLRRPGRAVRGACPRPSPARPRRAAAPRPPGGTIARS